MLNIQTVQSEHKHLSIVPPFQIKNKNNDNEMLGQNGTDSCSRKLFYR